MIPAGSHLYIDLPTMVLVLVVTNDRPHQGFMLQKCVGGNCAIGLLLLVPVPGS